MNKEEIQSYISALADRDISGLSEDEVRTIEKLLDEHPEYFDEYQLDMVTKICLTKHNQQMKCPLDTQAQIKTSLTRMLNALQSSR